jgi:23S rRNA pseudouridine2604 synthase
MRLNKFIADSGTCSRRDADALIAARQVRVNGVVAGLGTVVGDGDEVTVKGRRIGARRKQIYIALNKPAGVTCTTDRRDPTNIVDFVGHPSRIFPIGRLDKDSEGLILLTTDGDIVNEILRAENRHEKEYRVTVDRPLTPDFISGMSAGVPILGTRTLPCRVSGVDQYTFRIVLTQGLNRQIRRMCEFFGYTVQRLQRTRIVNIELGRLKRGHWRDLAAPELAGLLPQHTAPNSPARPPRPVRPPR